LPILWIGDGNTPLWGLHHKDFWLTFSECRTNGDTMTALAKRFVHRREHRLSLAPWRHRFLARINTTDE